MRDAPGENTEAYERAARLVELLPFRRPWSLDSFLAAIGVMIGTPITVGALPDLVARENITGLWVPNPMMHSIFVPASATGKYREHLVCHEIGHIVMAYTHTSAEIREMLGATLARIAPRLPRKFVEHRDPPQFCYARTSFMHPIEQEAEWLATLIMDRASEVRQPLYPATMSAQDQAFLGRIAELLGWHA